MKLCLDENYSAIKLILVVFAQFRIGLVFNYITNIYKCSYSRAVRIALVMYHKKRDDC